MIATLTGTAIGAAAGFAYHRWIGCRSGACPIWANPWASTIYGAVLGTLFAAA